MLKKLELLMNNLEVTKGKGMLWLTITLLISTAGLFIGEAEQIKTLASADLNTIQTDFSDNTEVLTKEIIQQSNLSNTIPESVAVIAKSITVKVLAGEGSGSGILIQRQGDIYTVLTNDHVLSLGNKYQIQTPDGKIYTASRYSVELDNNDLGLIRFQSSNKSYSIASLDSGKDLMVGDQLFAAGFPIDIKVFANQQGDYIISHPEGFVLTYGRVSLVNDKILAGGYQLGYTNDIQKGMSGGPVLNYQGQVVAINGMHAYPLWGDPYVYKDGSKPCTFMRDFMIHYSWGIPMETFIKIAPKL